MKCLETRRRNGMKWRRYRTEEGASWTTYEVPIAVVSELGPKTLKESLERAQRKLERLNRNARALRMLSQGIKPLAVAVEVGLSESQVTRIRREAHGSR